MSSKSSLPDQLTAADRDWLASVIPSDQLPTIPHGAELVDILGDLGVPHRELDQALRLRPRLDDHDQLREVIDRILTVLVSGIGTGRPLDRLPDLSPVRDQLAPHGFLEGDTDELMKLLRGD